jgi:hypothetical protein
VGFPLWRKPSHSSCFFVRKSCPPRSKPSRRNHNHGNGNGQWDAIQVPIRVLSTAHRPHRPQRPSTAATAGHVKSAGSSTVLQLRDLSMAFVFPECPIFSCWCRRLEMLRLLRVWCSRDADKHYFSSSHRNRQESTLSNEAMKHEQSIQANCEQ